MTLSLTLPLNISKSRLLWRRCGSASHSLTLQLWLHGILDLHSWVIILYLICKSQLWYLLELRIRFQWWPFDCRGGTPHSYCGLTDHDVCCFVPDNAQTVIIMIMMVMMIMITMVLMMMKNTFSGSLCRWGWRDLRAQPPAQPKIIMIIIIFYLCYLSLSLFCNIHCYYCYSRLEGLATFSIVIV